MQWDEDDHEIVVLGDQEQVWSNLVHALGIPTRLNLPHFVESKRMFPDVISQGMRLEVIGTHGTAQP
jgi:hypothetical protein